MSGAAGEEDISVSQHDKTTVAMDIEQAIAALPEPVSLCIVLSYRARLSHPDIVQVTNMHLGTVKSHIRRGSEKLRQYLAAYDETAAPEDSA